MPVFQDVLIPVLRQLADWVQILRLTDNVDWDAQFQLLPILVGRVNRCVEGNS